MNDALRTAAAPAAVPDHEHGSTAQPWWLGATSRTLERERLEHQASQTDATAQLRRCFPRWRSALEQLTSQALARLARNEPIDPNDPDAWRSRDAHAQAVLHRHGHAGTSATRLTSTAIAALIDGQAHADSDAGLDWRTVTRPGEPTRRAAPPRARTAAGHARGPGRLGSHAGPAARARQPPRIRRTPGRRPVALGARPPRRVRPDGSAVLANRLEHMADARGRAAAAGRRRSSGRSALFVVPALKASDGWQLMPVLALDMIRLIAELGGRLERDLRSAVVPITARAELLERINVHTLHAGPKRMPGLGRAARAGALPPAAGPLSPGVPRDKRDRWGRLAVHRRSYKERRTAPRRPSSSCGYSRSRRAGSASGGWGQRRARSSTRTRAR